MRGIFKSFCALVLIVSISTSSLAQLPSNLIGSNPFRLKWNQINTDQAQIIFPEGMESKAMHLANMITYMAENNIVTISDNLPQTPIILYNLSVLSNGVVTVGPFRSEFYMVPPQFDCTTDWLESLAIHEFRHVMQFGHGTQGLSKTVKKVLGSWAWGGMMATALPRWYFEGDAVVFETALSQSGRGRLPAFLMEYKSLLLDDIDYNYEKASAGSMKDFVPDWYRLGFSMIAHARNRFGENIMKDVASDAVQYKGLFYPFSRSLRKRTGLSTKELYEETMSELKNSFIHDWENQDFTFSNQLSKPHDNNVVNYNHPLILKNGDMLILKSALDELPAIYKYSAMTEKKIFEPGILLDMPMASLSESMGYICWAALDFDIRWRNENFNNIYIYDLKAGKKNQITENKRYFSPDISSDAQQIVTVEIDTHTDASLVILDAQSGEIIKRLENPENVFYAYPRWYRDDISIISVARSNEMHSIIEINIESEKQNTLVPPGLYQISHPIMLGDTIYFSMAKEGTNNIFAHSIVDKKTYKLTNVPIGAFQPSVSKDNNKLYFSHFGSKGYELHEMPLDSALWSPVDNLKSQDSKSGMAILVEQEGGAVLDKIPNEQFEIKKYNKWSGIINPHSIIPILEHPLAGVQILSDNTFSTLSADAGIFYQYNEDEWRYNIGLNYAELFPVMHARYGRFNRSAVLRDFQTISDTSFVATIFAERWKENRFSTGLSIPLNLSKGNFLRQFTFAAFYRHIKLDAEGRFDLPDYSNRDTINFESSLFPRIKSLEKEVITNQSFNALDFVFNYRSFKRMAIQDLKPDWGWSLGFRYRSSIFSENVDGDVWLANANLFFPGLTSNHHLYFNLMAQGENILDNYRFSDQFDYPRGYDVSIRRDEFYKIGINYSFPLFYPDAGISSLAFVKRIKANVFFDYGIIRVHEFPLDTNTDKLRSTGLELTFDFRALRLLEVDLGIRYSYLLDERFNDGQKHQFDFLLIKITDR